jgi:hypothetical protein
VEVLSTVEWSSETCEVRFVLCEQDFATLSQKRISAVLYRSDSYDILSKPALLAEAKIKVVEEGGDKLKEGK